jgi:hypothetical protein
MQIMTTVEVDSTQALSRQPQENPAALSANLIDAITRAAKDPSVDVDKMSKLLEMHMRMVAVAAEASFNQAFARLQPQLPRIAKRGLIGRGTDREIAYARFEDICEVTLPLLWREGFTVSFSERLTAAGNMMEIVATFRHSDGHSTTSSAYTPLTDDSGGKNKVQGGGSVYSYGQRYAYCKFLNIVTENEDDDGTQAAMHPIDDKKVSEITDIVTDLVEKGKMSSDDVFLKFMGVKRIEDILNQDYKKATSALKQKGKK